MRSLRMVERAGLVALLILAGCGANRRLAEASSKRLILGYESSATMDGQRAGISAELSFSEAGQRLRGDCPTFDVSASANGMALHVDGGGQTGACGEGDCEGYCQPLRVMGEAPLVGPEGLSFEIHDDSQTLRAFLQDAVLTTTLTFGTPIEVTPAGAIPERWAIDIEASNTVYLLRGWLNQPVENPYPGAPMLGLWLNIKGPPDAEQTAPNRVRLTLPSASELPAGARLAIGTDVQQTQAKLEMCEGMDACDAWVQISFAPFSIDLP